MTKAINIDSKTWDAIIVGTGMGGATIGYALAKAGKRVLFCERGENAKKLQALKGDYAETFFSDKEASKEELLRKAGRWENPIDYYQNGHLCSAVPFIGSGTGGSTALYGMVLERFHPEDFDITSAYRKSPEASLEPWPITYQDLAPYYEQAENLYRVKGGIDPLGPPREKKLPASNILTPVSKEFYDFFKNKGLHPYTLPRARETKTSCKGCQGYLCAHTCKNDSRTICLDPAVEKHGAILWDNCEITRLEVTGDRITAVRGSRNGKGFSLSAPLVILAAGALATPEILLRSKSKEHPEGLANSSGLVGKYLMRHFTDLYTVFPQRKHSVQDADIKEIGFNDLYSFQEEKLGTVQTFGALPPAETITYELEESLRSRRIVLFFFKFAKPFLSFFIKTFLSRTYIFASIIEDLPYEGNTVAISPAHPDRVVISYTIHPDDQRRINLSRQKLRKLFKPFHFLILKQASNNLRIAHASGTCRFGTDPRKSVLNPHNRVHDIQNLYIVDSSFFPSISGTNPSLTIAANALRVADHILNIKECTINAQMLPK